MRLVIAEDTVLLREGLAGLLEDAGHTVVARVGDAESLLAVVAEHEPDLAIVDVRMPPTYEDEGMRAAVEIRRLHPDTAVLVLSQHVESRNAVALVSSGGGFGYLLKDRVLDVDEFLEAADRVRNGGSALDPEVVKQLLLPPQDDPGPAHPPRAGGAGADGGGQDERRHRPAVVAHGEDRGDPRQLDPRKARPAPRRRHAPSCARGRHLPPRQHPDVDFARALGRPGRYHPALPTAREEDIVADHVATAETEIEASPAEVWKALTDPELIKKYMFGSEVVTDWQPGSPITWKGEYEGKPYEDKGEILEVEQSDA